MTRGNSVALVAVKILARFFFIYRANGSRKIIINIYIDTFSSVVLTAIFTKRNVILIRINIFNILKHVNKSITFHPESAQKSNPQSEQKDSSPQTMHMGKSVIVSRLLFPLW